MTLPDVGVKVTHPGAPVFAYRATKRLLPGVHPDVHCELLFGDEPLAALGAHVLPAVIALVSLLAKIQATSEPVLLAASAAAPPLGPRVHRLVVQQRVLVTSLEVAAGVVTFELIWLNVHIFDMMFHRRPFLYKFGTDVAGDVIGFMNSFHMFLQNLKSFKFLITFFTEETLFWLVQHLSMYIF